jgi:hypothetical protein
MKTNITLKSTAYRVLLLIAMVFAMMMAFAPASRAGLTGLYTNDYYTMHLWHLQDTNGTVQYDATNGIFEFDYATNVLAAQLLMSNAPGYNAFGNPANEVPPNNEVTPTNYFYSLAGQPGPGSVQQFQVIGTNFGYGMSIMTTQYSCFYAPWDDIGNVDYPDPSYANSNNCCDSFCNTNTGAFTWEALVCPNFNPLTFTADKNPEVLCMDGPNNTGPNVEPYSERAIQFRFDNATPSSGAAELEFNGGISDVSPIHDFDGVLPTTGPDAVAQGTWYHIAAAYTGTTPTNGDTPNVFTLYWTKFDPTRTNADVLTNFHYAFTITNTVTHTANSLPYPSNSIVGTSIFAIGGSGRNFPGQTGGAGGWDGWIAEVRISDYYRHSNEFMFNPTVVPSKPIVSPIPTNNFLGYGQTFSLSLQVSGSQPLAYQWYQNGLSLAGQTNASLVYSNINYSFNTNIYYAIVTNGYGSATSLVASVTVGANLEGFFNTGCGPNDNPLDQSAPGSVDLHWIFPPGGNPDNNSPNVIVWGDGGPLQSGGGVVPANGASVWVGPHENSGKVAGTYSFQTSFQVDETVVSTNTVISGTVGACSSSVPGPIQMFLNGVETDVPLSGNPAETVYAFNLTNGLQPGSNTLVCTAAQTASGNSGNVGFNFAVISDVGVALTNAPAITNQPVGVTNVIGSTVSFSSVALGAPPLSYYWLSNGVAVTQPVWVYSAVPYLSFVATNIAPSQLVGTNYFANYQVVFSNFVGTVTSTVATLNIQVPPLTVAAAGVPIWDATNSQTNIVVYFSSAVDPLTGTNAGNYSLNSGSVLSAKLGGAPDEIILTTTLLNPLDAYTLTVQNVNSVYGFEMNPSPTMIAVGTYPATVALWVKASTGVTADGSGNVSQWNDLSGNGNNLTDQGFGPPYDPTLATNQFGYPVIHFIGTNGNNYNQLVASDAPDLEITSNMSVFAVITFDTMQGGTNGDIISKTADNNEAAPYDYYANSSVVQFLRGNGSASVAVSSTTLPSVGVTHIVDVVMNGTSVTHRLDGANNGTGTLNATITDGGQPVCIGMRQDAHNRLTGDINELILVGQALSSSDAASMEGYFATEYTNLTLIQPVTINPNPTNIVATVANNQLTLSWPTDHTGWQLQAQTNPASVGISTDWVNYNPSTATNEVTIPVNLTNGTVFYRLIYTP